MKVSIDELMVEYENLSKQAKEVKEQFQRISDQSAAQLLKELSTVKVTKAI